MFYQDFKWLSYQLKDHRDQYSKSEEIIVDGFKVYKRTMLGKTFLDTGFRNMDTLFRFLTNHNNNDHKERIEEIMGETGESFGNKTLDIVLRRFAPTISHQYFAHEQAPAFWKDLTGLEMPEDTEYFYLAHPYQEPDIYIPISTAYTLAKMSNDIGIPFSGSFTPAPWLFCEEPKWFATYYNCILTMETNNHEEDRLIQALETKLQSYIDNGNKLSSVRQYAPLQDELKKFGLYSEKENYNKLIFLNFYECKLLYQLYDEWLTENGLKDPPPDPRDKFPAIHNLLYYDTRSWERDATTTDDMLSELNQSIEKYFELYYRTELTEEQLTDKKSRKEYITDTIWHLDIGIDYSGKNSSREKEIEYYFEEKQWKALLKYFRAVQQLNLYKNSEEREKQDLDWSPENGWYGGTFFEDGVFIMDISLEWFLDNKTPEGYNAFDWLAKCEKLMKESGYEEEPAIFFATIDGKHVQLERGMETRSMKLMNVKLM